MSTSDPFETTDVRDDAAYWDELAGRVSTFATRVAKRTTLDWLAARKPAPVKKVQ